VHSSTNDSFVQLGVSSREARVARLKDFSRRVGALASLAGRVSADDRLSPQRRDELLARVESSLCRASAELSKGSYQVGGRGLWLPAGRQGADVRKDSIRTSPTT